LSRTWTRLDILCVGVGLLLLFSLIGERLYIELEATLQSADVIENINSISKAVHKQKSATSTWFPPGVKKRHIYIDPFAEQPNIYQGLDARLLWREENYGIVLQLIRFDESYEFEIDSNTFSSPLKTGQPYLRLLLDYGVKTRHETAILRKVEHKLEKASLSQIDDHLYVLDLRALTNE
jgi:hypothetical protein